MLVRFWIASDATLDGASNERCASAVAPCDYTPPIDVQVEWSGRG